MNERPHFETWEDVVRWARAKIVESAKYNGDGEDGRAAWYEKQPSDWRPDFTRVPITPLPKGRDPMVEPMAMAEASGATGTGGQRTGGTPPSPLDRPIATWSQGDVRILINSPAYLRSQHPRHTEAQRMVRLWFEEEFGTSPAAVDATGRMVRDRPGRRPERVAKDGACQVQVRAHTRDGGKVEVREHCRAKSA